ncbi:thioredoxin family protein [Geomicrobium sp. JCM 19038]|uniref:thioredoxin family protein n=1 Tax=Geomicrobium sp. JCM 19038 TaxID=1460635 RepID=UPI00045F39DE|nr:thioredoxin family protein [Geomicrobium sp. JCM 19038]GAK06700.1 hypothetical protein JCM19038_403 [Geomicrobium sp. JCM 19038]
MIAELSEQQFNEYERGYVLVVSPFCYTCQIAERFVYEASKVCGIEGSVYKINLQLTKHIAEKEQIMTVPTLLYKNGDHRERLVTMKSVANVVHWMSAREEEH